MDIEHRISELLSPLYEALGSIPQTDVDGELDRRGEYRATVALLKKKGVVYDDIFEGFTKFENLRLKGVLNNYVFEEHKVFSPSFHVKTDLPFRRKDILKLVNQLYLDYWGDSAEGAFHFPTAESIESEFERGENGLLLPKKEGSQGYELFNRLVKDGKAGEKTYDLFREKVDWFNKSILSRMLSLNPKEAYFYVPCEEIVEGLPVFHEGKFILRPDNVLRLMYGQHALSFHCDREQGYYDVRFGSSGDVYKLLLGHLPSWKKEGRTSKVAEPLTPQGVAPDSYFVKLLASFERDGS